jgi:hypothetical protein
MLHARSNPNLVEEQEANDHLRITYVTQTYLLVAQEPPRGTPARAVFDN